jgi:endonuclease III
VEKMGGPQNAKMQALAQEGKEAKIAFMNRFHGIGPKFARNIWMDAYHPDFHDTIAVDLRIKKVTKALGYSFKSYEQEERFYQEIAKEAGLQGWETDRLLYEYTDHFTSAIVTGENEQKLTVGSGSGGRR